MFVCQAVAVIVYAVPAELGNAGIDQRIAVVAVTGQGNGNAGAAAGSGHGYGRIAVAVGIKILVAILTGFIQAAAAVIINTVADFHRAGMNGRIRIVAIRVVGHITRRLNGILDENSRITVVVPVTVLIPGHTTFVRIAVTVVIDTVPAEFGSGRINGGIIVVTIAVIRDIPGRLKYGLRGHSGVAEFITVDILVPRHTAVIGRAAAVVVDAVAADFGSGRINGGIIIVAVTGPAHVTRRRNGIHNGNRGIAECITVNVLIPGHTAFICNEVTVIVQAVTDFRRPGMHGRFGIIAVRTVQDISGRLNHGHGRDGTVAVAVTIAVLVPGQAAFIHGTVTVFIIHTVAHFRRRGIDERITVITVRIVQNISGRLGLGHERIGGIAVTITVAVSVPGQAALIGIAVTVVVHTVANLGRARMHGGIAVITVRAVQDISGRLDLSHCGYTRITVIVTVVVLVPGQAALIAVAVTVVVHTVANLGRTRMHGGIAVITVRAVQNISGRLRL